MDAGLIKPKNNAKLGDNTSYSVSLETQEAAFKKATGLPHSMGTGHRIISIVDRQKGT
jgi:hypothetical protein